MAITPRYRTTACLAACAAACAAHAQVEIGMFHNPNLNSGRFGEAIVQDGDLVYISAPLGGDAGAVYVYNVDDPLTIINTFTPSDVPDDGIFGHSIAVEGDRVLIGAPTQSTTGPKTRGGVVYFYDTAAGTEKKLLPNDPQPFAEFGNSIVICGSTAFIGAPGFDQNPPGGDEGAVYVFDLATCQQVDKFHAPAADILAGFGLTMTKQGNVLMVGAPYESDHTGAVHTYNATTYEYLDTYESDDPQPFSDFGTSVALTGFAALIGAPLASDGDQTAAGAVSATDETGQNALYTFSTGNEGDEAGRSIDVDDAPERSAVTLAIIGAPGDDDGASGAGAAYIINAATGHIVTKLTASNAGTFDLFGSTVSIHGDHAIVSAPNEDTDGNNAGAVYLFDITTLPCPADLDANGTLNFDDIDAFVAAFLSGDLLADLDANGIINLDDLDAFVASFLAGCP